MSAQLVFDLPQRAARDREAFFVAPSNEEAVHVIDGFADSQEPVQWLYGPGGSGKSHLAAVLAAQMPTHALTLDALDAAMVSEVMATTDGFQAIIIDDVDGLTAAQEEPLFHLFNHCKNGGPKLLLLSQVPARQMAINLPDLRSRLAAVPAVGLAQPDDKLMAGLLDKLFADRQINLDEKVRDYLVPRIARDFAAMGALVKAIDEAALAAQKPITVPFVARFLDSYNSVM
ncbi:MAG: HdaA/DnaA family protein [Parvibaculales bacterium]